MYTGTGGVESSSLKSTGGDCLLPPIGFFGEEGIFEDWYGFEYEGFEVLERVGVLYGEC